MVVILRNNLTSIMYQSIAILVVSTSSISCAKIQLMLLNRASKCTMKRLEDVLHEQSALSRRHLCTGHDRLATQLVRSARAYDITSLSSVQRARSREPSSVDAHT